MKSVGKFLLSLCCLALLLTFVHGRRTFEFVLESIKCSSNPKYINESSCHIDQNLKPPKGFLVFQMYNVVKGIRLSFEMLAFKSNNERISIFKATDIDGCTFFEGRNEMTLIKIARQIMVAAGKLPKCPVPADYRFDFKNFFVDAEMFPPYVPEAKFGMLINAVGNDEFLYSVEVISRSVNKRKTGRVG